MVPLTPALQAALAQPTTEPYVLVDLATLVGTYHFAREQVTWSGIAYTARLVQDPEIALSFGDPAAGGAATPGTVTLTLANADGFFSQQRPSWWRGQRCTVREVLLTVQSDALRTFTFIVLGATMPDPTTFTLTCGDLLSPYRQVRVPPLTLTITSAMFPNLQVSGNQGAGAVLPLLEGQAFCPVYLVDNQDPTGNQHLVACVGSAGSLNVNGPILVIDQNCTFAIVARSDTQGQHIFVGTSVVAGVPVTMVTADRTIALGWPPVAHWALLAGPGYNGGYLGYASPDRVLLDLLTNSWWGAGVPATDIDSASLSWTERWANQEDFGIVCQCVLDQAQPLDAWLQSWSHDCLTYLVLRDKIALVPASASRWPPVASFHPGNILQGTLTITETALNEQASVRAVTYRDVTRDPVLGPSVQSWAVGSAVVVTEIDAPFLGTPSAAFRCAQYWARVAAAGVRQYTLGTTLRVGILDPGDLVTVQHPLLGPNAISCEVTGVRRQGGVVTYTLREFPSDTFSKQGVEPADPPFGAFQQQVPVASLGMPGGVVITFTSSHQLQRVPTVAIGVPAAPWLSPALQTSLVAADVNQFTLAAKQTALGMANTGLMLTYVQLWV